MKDKLRNLIPQPLLRSWRNLRTWMRLKSPRIARNAVGDVDHHWRERIDNVVSSPDNAFIIRVADAGQLKGCYITMHNGVKVCANGYYGGGILNMLIENRGVHEPQEERAFGEVIEYLPERCCMLELGAYWGFYSLSLLQRRPHAQCYLVEPEAINLVSGKINFRLNKRKGIFVQAMVDAVPKLRPPTITVDSFCEEKGIKHLHILHADIQGYESTMLTGAHDMLSQGRVDYLFISTHSNMLHYDCSRKLTDLGYSILAEADLNGTFSYDGLIVAKRVNLSDPEKIDISQRSAQSALH